MEMTITKAEFLRLLPAAVAAPFEQRDNEFRSGDGSRGWRLRLEELPPARLGNLELGRLAVAFEFQGFTPKEKDDFLARFRLHYHRGGG
jgi:hypothetical protein